MKPRLKKIGDLNYRCIDDEVCIYAGTAEAAFQCHQRAKREKELVRARLRLPNGLRIELTLPHDRRAA